MDGGAIVEILANRPHTWYTGRDAYGTGIHRILVRGIVVVVRGSLGIRVPPPP